MSIYAQESGVNLSKGYRTGDSGVYETYCETTGELYRASVREHGRCTGRVYIDTDDGPRAIGWTFLKRDHYEDTGEPFLRETWVTVHDAPDTVTRTHHYHYLTA